MRHGPELEDEMRIKAKAKRAGLDESEARDLKLLARALGIRIRSVEVVPAEKQDQPKRGKVFNYAE